METWKVDVIVCPFGFQKNDDYLAKVITRFSRGDAAILAASSNAGANETIPFPARHPRVVPIFPADAFGNSMPYSPTPIGNDLSFSALASVPRLSTKGSSIAVCVAAATVANVYQLLRERAVLSPHEALKSRSTEGVKALLKGISRARGGFNYIIPWLTEVDPDELDEDETVAGWILNNMKSQITHIQTT